MGLSKSCADQRQRERRTFRRILIGAVVAAIGLHLSSVPLTVQFMSSLIRSVAPSALSQNPTAIIVVEEDVPPEPEVSPPPPEETAVDNEPAAAADQDSAPPLPTDESVVPQPTTNTVDTVPTQAAIASDRGVPDGAGAAGDSTTVGTVSGDGSPSDFQGPLRPPNVSTIPRQTVPTIARRQEADQRGARVVSCDPCTLPDYPESQSRRSREGLPVISAVFDGSGNVISAAIASSSGNSALDEAALQEAQENWRFQDPYGIGGRILVNIAFVIEGSEQYETVQSTGTRESVELPVQQSAAPPAVAQGDSVVQGDAVAQGDSEPAVATSAPVDIATSAPAPEPAVTPTAVTNQIGRASCRERV